MCVPPEVLDANDNGFEYARASGGGGDGDGSSSYSAKSDVWMFGATVFKLTTGAVFRFVCLERGLCKRGVVYASTRVSIGLDTHNFSFRYLHSLLLL